MMNSWMIDSTAMRVHAHAANPGGGQAAQAMGRSRSSLSTKIHLACDALGYPPRLHPHQSQRIGLRSGQAAVVSPPTSYRQGDIMDKGYDSDATRAYMNQLGGIAVIPPKANRTLKPDFDQHL
jgi:hypothetical protein